MKMLYYPLWEGRKFHPAEGSFFVLAEREYPL